MKNRQIHAKPLPKTIKSLIRSHFDMAELGAHLQQPKLIVEAHGLPDGMIAIGEPDIHFDATGMRIGEFMAIGWTDIVGYYADCDRVEINLASGQIIKFETAIG